MRLLWILFSIVCWLVPEQVQAEARVALVIANSGYDKDIGALPNPVNDGRLVAKSLEAAGFKVSLVTDADQRGMKRAIADFSEALAKVAPNATGLFYFAGHGIQVGGANYLVPIGAQIKREADVDLEAVDAETVLKQLEFAGANVNIIILDACRNNPLSRGFRSAGGGLSRIDAPTGSFVAYSTAPGRVASDGTGENSPFATALAAEIEKPGVSLEETFRNVRGSVMAATNGQQVPWDSSSLTAPFYFMPGAPAAADQATTGSTGDSAAVELAYWHTVENSQDPAELQAFLKKFPNGAFAEVAQIKLAKLQQAGTASATAPDRASNSHDYADKELAGLSGELRLPHDIVKALRVTEAFQTLPTPKPLRAEIEYSYADGKSRETDTYEVQRAIDGLAVGEVKSVRLSEWNGVAEGEQSETDEFFVTAGPMMMAYYSNTTSRHAAETEQAYSAGKMFEIAAVDGSIFPIDAGKSMTIKHRFGSSKESMFGRDDEITVGDAFECKTMLDTLGGRCFEVRLDSSLDTGGDTAFTSFVFVEDLGAFLPSGEFGAADNPLGRATITRLEPK